MKIPLRFQVTEFDCGTVSLLNAFSYLFEREEIPVELVKAIHNYTLDCYDSNGNMGARGTSREAINKLSHWITRFASQKKFGVKCNRLVKDEIKLDDLKECIKNKGVIFARSWLINDEHYIIITNIKNNNVYIFDPYYLDKNYYKLNSKVRIVFNQPFRYNRVIKLNKLLAITREDFSLGPIETRECVLINKIY